MLSPCLQAATLGATTQLSCKPLALAAADVLSTAASIHSCKLKSCSAKCKAPASMRARSSTLSIRPSSVLPLTRIMSTNSARRTGSAPWACSNCAAPITPFKGLRNSWLMLAKNRVLAFDAASANWRAPWLCTASLCSAAFNAASASPRRCTSSSMWLKAAMATPTSSCPAAGNRRSN